MIQLQRCFLCGDLAIDVDKTMLDDVHVCEQHKDLQLNNNTNTANQSQKEN